MKPYGKPSAVAIGACFLGALLLHQDARLPRTRRRSINTLKTSDRALLRFDHPGAAWNCKSWGPPRQRVLLPGGFRCRRLCEDVVRMKIYFAWAE
jgi:hypothetical protein